MIYKTEEERFGYQSYRWNAMFNYYGSIIRFTVVFGKQGNFIRISELSSTGWNVIADDWCIEVKKIKNTNPYSSSNDFQTYVRCQIEKAMLQFVVDFYTDKESFSTRAELNSRMEMISSMDAPEQNYNEHENSDMKKHPHGVTDTQSENSYF